MSYLGDLIEHCNTRLLSSMDTSKAREYLRSLGFTSEDVLAMQIGWAPEVRLPGVDQTFELYNCMIYPILDQDGIPVGLTIQEIPQGAPCP